MAMMVLRVVLAIAFLGITVWFQIKQNSLTDPTFYLLYAIIVVVCVLTILYAATINWAVNLRLFAYIQITIDMALVTVSVYVTGGIESYLTFLYLLTIMGSGILLNRTGGLYAATVSSVAYGFLIDMDFYGMLPARYKVFWIPVNFAWQDVITTLSSNMLAFYTVAYLSGYLAERTALAEKELHEKGVDLERLERLSRHIFENISSGIMTLDSAERVTSFNRAAEAITGYGAAEVYLRSVHDYFPGMLRPADAFAGTDLRLEQVFRRRDGAELFLGFTVSKGATSGIVEDKGLEAPGEVSTIVIFQDLTHMKAMEEQLRRADRLRVLGELSVGIAHEIRNPLASISGSIQVLRSETRLDGEDRRLMDIVLRETDRLNLLITDFLLFAKPARREMARFSLSAVINETITIFRNSPDAAKVRIEKRLDDSIYIDGDFRQVGQIFWNLFLNAAHAMDSGGVLSVSSSVAGRMAAVSVSDTGPGIEPENVGRIFDPFFSTKDRGTGLGLPIAHRIAESHGGSLEVKSYIGKGTVFTVTLPLAGTVILA